MSLDVYETCIQFPDGEHLNVADRFNSMAIHPLILKTLENIGRYPTPLQSVALPLALMGKDLIVVAKNNSGKAFSLALLAANVVQTSQHEDGILGLVLCSTLKVAYRVSQHLKSILGDDTKFITLEGDDAPVDKDPVTYNKFQIIIGLASTTSKLIKEKRLQLSICKFVAFYDALCCIEVAFKCIDIKSTQVVVFAPVMSSQINEFMNQWMTKPNLVYLTNSKKEDSLPPVSMHIKEADDDQCSRCKVDVPLNTVRDQPSDIDDKEWLRLYSSAYNRLEKTNSVCQRQQHGIVGFQLMQNTCYMNATLQAIINTPSIKDIFNKNVFFKNFVENIKFGTKATISAVFSALVDLYFSGVVSSIKPKAFLTAFATEVDDAFANQQQQHDAQEFQILLIDALRELTNRVQSPKPFKQNYNALDMVAHEMDYDAKLLQYHSSPIGDLFGFRTVSIVKCTTCSTSSPTFVDQTQLSLELVNDDKSMRLIECLESHFQSEVLQHDDCWYCPKCDGLKVATRQTFIWRMPKILVIHLKRFSQIKKECVKNEAHVYYEIESLELDRFYHPHAPQLKVFFSMYAITQHAGTLTSGHYTSLIKKEDGWYKFDDDHVSMVTGKALQSRNASVLFYSACEHKEQPFQSSLVPPPSVADKKHSCLNSVADQKVPSFVSRFAPYRNGNNGGVDGIAVKVDKMSINKHRCVKCQNVILSDKKDGIQCSQNPTKESRLQAVEVHTLCGKCVVGAADYVCKHGEGVAVAGAGINCTKSLCNGIFLFSRMRPFLSDEIAKKFQAVIDEKSMAYLQDDPNVRSFHCEKCANDEIVDKALRFYECSKCRAYQCCFCGRLATEAHKIRSCEEMDDAERKNSPGFLYHNSILLKPKSH